MIRAEHVALLEIETVRVRNTAIDHQLRRAIDARQVQGRRVGGALDIAQPKAVFMRTQTTQCPIGGWYSGEQLELALLVAIEDDHAVRVGSFAMANGGPDLVVRNAHRPARDAAEVPTTVHAHSGAVDEAQGVAWSRRDASRCRYGTCGAEVNSMCIIRPSDARRVLEPPNEERAFCLDIELVGQRRRHRHVAGCIEALKFQTAARKLSVVAVAAEFGAKNVGIVTYEHQGATVFMGPKGVRLFGFRLENGSHHLIGMIELEHR